jgi:NAD(P)H-dependent FMN reductase
MLSPLVISTSLRNGSLSRAMADQLVIEYAAVGAKAEEIDLRQWPLPLCDGDAAYADPSVEKLASKIQAASVIILATPVYNFHVSAATKNLIELTGSAWEDKLVGFLCAAGGASSYMSVMQMANSLMLDFRCLILPRFVYGVSSDFVSTTQPGPELSGRLRQLAEDSLKIRRD